MKTTITVNYQWWRDDHSTKLIPARHQQLLDEEAMGLIIKMMREGYREGDLFSAVYGKTYRGWWTVNKERGGGSRSPWLDKVKSV